MKCEECKYNGTMECYAIKLAEMIKRPVTPDGCSKGERNETIAKKRRSDYHDKELYCAELERGKARTVGMGNARPVLLL